MTEIPSAVDYRLWTLGFRFWTTNFELRIINLWTIDFGLHTMELIDLGLLTSDYGLSLPSISKSVV